MVIKKIAAYVCLLLFLHGCNSSNEVSRKESQELKARLDSARAGQIVREIYEQRGFRPVWTSRGKKLPNLQQFFTLVQDDALQQRAASEPIQDPAQFDVEVTSALMKYARSIARKDADVGREVTEAVANGSIVELAHKLEPIHPEYAALKNAVLHATPEQREQIEINLRRWRSVPDDLGETHIRVNVPAFQLEVHDAGKVPLKMKVIVGKSDTPTPLFSSTMRTVVFSPYWNIPESILTKETLPKIQKDPDYAERQQYEVVRVSGKKTQIIDPEDVDWSAVNPAKILVRQKPGVLNSLGMVKFLLPNDYDVYLHDTPSVKLFSKPVRNLSHGCVRIEKPEELAEYVLRDQPEWTPQRIHTAMHSGDERQVPLKKPIPVYLFYFTAWVDDGGELHLEKDIYGYDSAASPRGSGG